MPDDVDICVSLDLDEVLMPGWRRVVERAWKPPINHLYYTHAWSKDVTGLWHNLLDNRIHARHGFTWRHRLPRDGASPRPCPSTSASSATCASSTSRTRTKSRSQYLPLLELAVAEDPELPRYAFYLAREYFFVGGTTRRSGVRSLSRPADRRTAASSARHAE